MEKLFRLVYRSFRMPNCDDKEIEKILESSKKNNPGRNITGILLHSDRKFIQYLEGSKQNLTDLYEMIKEDKRHSSINQLDFMEIPERIFPSWLMGYKDVSKNIQFTSKVTANDSELFEKILLNELDFSNDGLRVLQLYFQRV